MAVDAHPAFPQTDVREVLFSAEDPAVVEVLVGLAEGVVADEVDVGTFTDFGLHMLQAKGQGVDPHFAFKGQLTPAPRHKGKVKAGAILVVEGVEDVVAVVDVAPVVKWTCESTVQQEHLVFVEVDVQKFRLHA